MPYEQYTKTTTRIGSPTITITSLFRISLNKAATRILEEKSAKGVLLFWDKDSKRIAMKLTTVDDGNLNTFKIHYGVKGNGAGFAAKTFLGYIGYDHSKRRSFSAVWNEKEQMLEVQLSPDAFKTGEAA